MIEKEKLILFLSNYIKKVEQDDLTKNEQLLLTNFFLEYFFDKKEIYDSEEDEKLKKYLSMGWYIYNFILTE